MKMQREMVEQFFYWVNERHAIYLKKESGQPFPWTDDAILRRYKFTNPFREHDRVTKWIDANIRKPYADHENLWYMLCIARYINWPLTLETMITGGWWPDDVGMIINFDPSFLTFVLEDIAEHGYKVYTGSYMIRAESDPSKEWYHWTKHKYIGEIVLGRIWEHRDKFIERFTSNSLEKSWELFQEPYYIGWGPFMAYEVVTDLRHTRYLNNATDIMTWANPGPGAMRGIKRLYGLGVNENYPGFNYGFYIAVMQYLLELSYGSFYIGSHVPAMEMRDIEHSLCEFDKYQRVLHGQGKPRSLYIPK